MPGCLACTSSQVQWSPAECVHRIDVGSAINQSPAGPKPKEEETRKNAVALRPHVLSVSVKCSKMQPLQKTTLIRPIRPSNLGPRLAPPHHQEGSDACQLTWTPGDPLGLPGVRNEDLHTTLYTPSHLPRTYVYSLLYGGPLCQNWRARALPATEARRSCRPGAWQTAGRSHNEPCHAMRHKY